MAKIQIGRAIGGGFVATVIMSAMMVLAPMLGMPKMDIAAMLGGMPSGGPAVQGSGAWIIGLGAHLFIGSFALSAVYALLRDVLPASGSLTKGMLYGALVWLMAQAIVMPMAGIGFFSSHAQQRVLVAAGSLAGHLLYGAILGLAYGTREAEAPVDGFVRLGL